MSVAIVLTAVTVIVIGYRVGRTHAAWVSARSARSEVPRLRRVAWARTRGLAGGVLLLLLVLGIAVNDVLR